MQPFPVLDFHTSSSASSWFYCIVFASLQSWASLLLLLAFPLAVMGLVSVRGVAAAPMVPAVAPPLFHPLWLLYPPLLHFVCSGLNCICSVFFPHTAFPDGPSSLPPRFFRMLRLLLPIFLHVFPHAAAPAAPPILPPRFPLAAATAAPFALWCGSCFLACCGFSGCGS